MKKNTNTARKTRNTFDPGASRAMDYTPMYTSGYDIAIATKSVKSFKILENTEKEAAGEEIPSLKNCADLEGFIWQTILKEFGSYYSNYEDLYEEGMLAIISASSKYDASCGTKTTYFYPYIKHAMFRWISENVMISTSTE